MFRVALGVLFIGGAIWSFVSPYDALWALAAAFGSLLILFSKSRSAFGRHSST